MPVVHRQRGSKALEGQAAKSAPPPADFAADLPAPTDEELRAQVAVAAVAAAADADTAAMAAASTNATARAVAEAAGLAAAEAKRATAAAVATAATVSAQNASRSATAVEAKAIARAAEVAESAATAVEVAAAELPAGGYHPDADRAAAAIAATVAADVIDAERTTAAAASTVAEAVATEAATAARAAAAAATAVEGAAAATVAASQAVSKSSARSADASLVVVKSTRRAADLAGRARLRADLRASEHRFSVTFEHAPLGMMLISLNPLDSGRILRVNPELVAIVGRTEGELLALRGTDLFHPDDRTAQAELFASLLEGDTSAYKALARWRHGRGHDIWVRTSLHAIRADSAHPAYAIGQIEDITEVRRTEMVLREREKRFRLAFDNAINGMMFVGIDGGLRKANRALTAFLGYSEEQLIGQSLQNLADADEQASIGAGLVALVAGESTFYQAEHSFVHADGSVVWGLLNGFVVHDVEGRPDYLVLQVKDVTTRKQAETQLAHQALHDELTGLPNRVLLGDHIKFACARAQRNGTHVAVLFLDLDDFKEINDSLGHVAGDEVLVQVAERLRSCLRDGDTAARLGGDEFVVVCEGLHDPREASGVAERIDRALSAPIVAGATQLYVTASVGINIAGGTRYPSDLLRGADTAMYQAKSNGKARYEIYQSEMSLSALRHVTVVGELSNAVARDELRLHYQPTYDMETGVIAGVEALLRWQHPTLGLLAPADFLDVAEGRRLMIPIGDWVLATAAEQARRWQREFGVRAPDMWVNVSGQQLGKQHLTGVVERILSETGLNSSKLGLEVTERQLIGRTDGVRADLVALRGLGLRLALDDFGTGFASMEYLRRFTFDEIKIDRTFVSGLGSDRTDTAVTSSVIALGRSLDLVVVAEGVETTDQYHRLKDLDCDLAQGHLLQRPAPPATIDLLLRDNVKYVDESVHRSGLGA